MDRESCEKYQVVFLIDKSLEHTKNFLNYESDRFHRCHRENNLKNNPENNSFHGCSSNHFHSSCGSTGCSSVEDFNQIKSRVCKSISLSALRILCYLFTKSIPSRVGRGESSLSYNHSKRNLKNEEDCDENNQNNEGNPLEDKNQKLGLRNNVEYLKTKQSSLQWSYKFFTSNKLPGKPEHHQLKDFKLRHFEEFEKDLEKQFQDLTDDYRNNKTNPTLKNNSSERRKSNSPAPSEILKRTLSRVLYDFNWENPDITSPVISRKTSLSKKRKRSSNSFHLDSFSTISSGPKNLVFLFQSCPSSKLELRNFAGKLVVDSEVFLDSFMPPSLFKEFVVNKNLSLFWVDHKIYDDVFHPINIVDYENESIKIVNEALVKLNGTLIPLESLTESGSLHWSSIFYNTKWDNDLGLHSNSPQLPSLFGNFFNKKTPHDDDDFPPLKALNKRDSNKVVLKNKSSKYQGKGLLPVTTVLDHFIQGRTTSPSTLMKDGGDLTKKPHLEAILIFDQIDNQPELCPLTFIPTNSSCSGTLEKFFTHLKCSNSDSCVEISMIEKHKQSNPSESGVQFTLSKPVPSSPLLPSIPQESTFIQLEVFSYLNNNNVCSTSDYVFFASVNLQPKCFANRNTKNLKASSILNSLAKFQSLLLQLAEAQQNLVLTVQLDGHPTSFLAVLQPLTVSIGLIVFFPMGLGLNLEKYFICKSKENANNQDDLLEMFQLETEYLDYVTQRFTKRLIHPKYFIKPEDMQKSDIELKKEVSKLNIFDSSLLNKWSQPCANNPEMIKMSISLDKTVSTEAGTSSSASRETNLLKQLKTLYRQAESPSDLVNKKQLEIEENKKLAESTSEGDVSQNGGLGEVKPRILQKLRSFTLAPTRAEMILSKSMQVVEQQSKVEKDDNIVSDESLKISLEMDHQVDAVIKHLDNDSALTSFIKDFYDSTITDNLNSWDRMHHIVAIVLAYMKEHNRKNPELDAKKFLEEQIYLSSSNLRKKYLHLDSSIRKQDKILEYQLQIILRMEMLLYLKLLLSPEDHAVNEDDGDNVESTLDAFVEEIVTMLRTLSFIADAAIVPVFLNDVLLKKYADTLHQPLADIYNELMQPLPDILATSIDSPESSVQSSFCPSTVSTCILDETTRDGFPEVSTLQAKRAKTMQVVPGLGEGVKRQIVVGKKPVVPARQNNIVKDSKNEKKEEETDAKEKVRARRSLFMSEKKKLERHRSFAVRDKDKSYLKSHRSSKASKVKSCFSAKKFSKTTMVAETPAHKQISQVMRRWHLLQNRLTEPMKKSPSTEVNTTPKRAKPDMSVSIIEESPLKEGIPLPKLSENCKKTTVLIRRGFYGLNSEKSQSRNLTKYLELADRIAGRHDRYAQLTDLSNLSQSDNTQSPANKPSSFALSQLMGSPSSNSPKTHQILKYTPNRKSPSFPFSASPKFSSQKILERVSVKQALFQTPEKNLVKIPESPHLSSSQSPHSSTSVTKNKLALFNSPPNKSNCIFKTPTKDPLCLFKSPTKTPTFKKLDATPKKTLLRKYSNCPSDMKAQLSDCSNPEAESSDEHPFNKMSAEEFQETNSVEAMSSLCLPSKASSLKIWEATDSLSAKPDLDGIIRFSRQTRKMKKQINKKEDNNNNHNNNKNLSKDVYLCSSFDFDSSPINSSSLSIRQSGNKQRPKEMQALQSDQTLHHVPNNPISSPTQSEHSIQKKRKTMVDDTFLLTNKRQRRLTCTLYKNQNIKDDQPNQHKFTKSKSTKYLYKSDT